MNTPSIQKLTIRDAAMEAPVWIIDHFYERPDELMKHVEGLDFNKDHNPHYPGLTHLTRSGMPRVLLILREAFGLAQAPLEGLSFFAKMDEVQHAHSCQRSPHVDPYAFAGVIYLSERNLGGTGFYQHEETKIWRTDQPRAALPCFTEQARDRGFASGPELYRYLKRDGRQGWKTLATVPAAFNRMALYPASLFHSALPGSEVGIRLTQNFFFRLGGKP